MSHSWGYKTEDGPSTWGKLYKQAEGKHQSPIDIDTNNTVYDPELVNKPLRFSYSKDCFTVLKNSGHSFTVSGSDSATSNVNGGPVNNNHNFLQFHMHWGANPTVGSEHTLNGQSFAAELHFVNWNSEKYKEPGQAVGSTTHDGLIVLGVFVKVGNYNPEFDKIVNSLNRVALNGQSVQLQDPINYNNLFPADVSSYYTYDGSLTTPPCNECVKWVVFKDPIEISSLQLNAFHNLYLSSNENECSDDHRQLANFRPVCELNDRKVRRSFN